MTKDEIKRNYDVLITYLSPFYDGALHLPTLDMSTNGRIHFVDVKNILVKIQYVMYATIMIAVIGGIYLLKRKMKSFTARIDFNNHFPIALMLPIAINFEKSFVLFHKLLFSNDYWVLILKKIHYINVTRRVLYACCVCYFIIHFRW